MTVVIVFAVALLLTLAVVATLAVRRSPRPTETAEGAEIERQRTAQARAIGTIYGSQWNFPPPAEENARYYK